MSETARAGSIVAARINALMKNPESPYTRRALAELRRGVGKEPGSVPQIWQYTHAEDANGRTSSWRENAVHLALTQWAMHQQSKTKQMHRQGQTFGGALRLLARGQDAQAPEKTPAYRRMMALASARSLPAITTHARGLIGLLRAQEIGFDYDGWANDLYWIQVPGHAVDVQRRWGRDFYRLQDTPGGLAADSGAPLDSTTQN